MFILRRFKVFSACAEMFLAYAMRPGYFYCLLCMRRDVSGCYCHFRGVKKSSLHAQRCFQRNKKGKGSIPVFSACAEMFLTKESLKTWYDSLLCMRRDVSELMPLVKLLGGSSLHAQRCF